MAKGGFRGMPGGMNQAAMMKQAQKMQEDMAAKQEELEAAEYEVSAGGGMVKISINGKIYEAKSVDVYIDQKQSVEVVGFENFSVIVKRLD